MKGNDLIRLGFDPAPWFGGVLKSVNEISNPTDDDLKKLAEDAIAALPKLIPLQPARDVKVYSTESGENFDTSLATITEAARTPTVVDAMLMPDACPAGPMGTIPVGGVIATQNAIHPGMHSADICCSMMVTYIEGDTTPKRILNAFHHVTHFGPGGRNTDNIITMPEWLEASFLGNKFLKDLIHPAKYHFGTQGDGNHFAFVGTSEKSGHVCLVTHHGSRKPGAMLYKAGMQVAEKYRKKYSPETLKQNAWIPADSEDGEEYWKALQIIRLWTKANHSVLHDLAIHLGNAKIYDRFWNEHNFVFKKGDVYYHAKGATPVSSELIRSQRSIIPMNLAEPVLIVEHRKTDFAPHGAGRYQSRTQHLKTVQETVEERFEKETQGIDFRFFCGKPDLTELPSAYKDAKRVQDDMEKFELAQIVDRILPYGGIMAGDWESDAPWKKGK